MAADGRPAIPVHVGAEPPRVYQERRDRADRFERAGELYNREYLLRRPQVSEDLDEVDASALGLELRWIGEQADDCVAAIHPGQFTNGGAEEFARLSRGAEMRGEPALLIKTLVPPDPNNRSIFGAETDVWLAGDTSVSGRPVGTGTRPTVVSTAHTADADLAKRVLNARGTDAQWWALSLSGQVWTPCDGSGPVRRPPEGTLDPLLVTNLDEPVMAVWTSPGGELRTYVLPPGHDWNSTLRWLVEKGLPAHAPTSMRALRSLHVAVPDACLSRAERTGKEALRELEAEYRSRHAAALESFTAAQTAADGIRDPLLYTQGRPLEDAVARVFRSTGAEVVDLDEEFGDSISADFLVRLNGQLLLVEVKSAQGAASERFMSQLVKHLEVWPNLRPKLVAERGLLVVSHDLRKPPEQRAAQPFARPEFLRSVPHPVVSSRQLLDWWLAEDWASIRGLVDTDAGVVRPDPTSAAPTEAGRTPRRSWWRRK